MKKNVWIALAVVIGALSLIALVVWWVVKPSDTQSSIPSNSTVGSGAYKPVDACSVLTQQVADSLLGANAEKSTTNNTTASDDINVSTCTYSSKHDGTVAGVKNMKTATILVRSPLTATGARDNMQPFDSPKAGTETVQGYGEKAFWDSEFGQLNIYKKGMWIIASLGVATPDQNTLQDAKSLAEKILPAL